MPDLQLDPLPAVFADVTDPLAQLLLVLTDTVLGPKAGIMSQDVPPELRCAWCGGQNMIAASDVRMQRKVAC